MKKRFLVPLSLILLLAGTLFASILKADTLLLKSGQSVEGIFLGGNSRSIRFEVGGIPRNYFVRDVEQIQFRGAGPVSGTRFVPFENGMLRMNRPADWTVAQDGDSWTIAPSGGRVQTRYGNQAIAYGVTM